MGMTQEPYVATLVSLRDPNTQICMRSPNPGGATARGQGGRCEGRGDEEVRQTLAHLLQFADPVTRRM
jgi:hypothetical protein